MPPMLQPVPDAGAFPCACASTATIDATPSEMARPEILATITKNWINNLNQWHPKMVNMIGNILVRYS